ncbi:MAG: glycosyltransferase [Bacteroidota bacterium]
MILAEILFLLAAFFQLIAWGFVLSKTSRTHLATKGQLNQDGQSARTSIPSHDAPPVSIIVCFRNEEERIISCLRAILRQTHPAMEVLAIDDYSTDASAALVERLSTHHPHLRLLRPPQPTRPGKKDALTFGITAATHDVILLTDADCIAVDPAWAVLMTEPFVDASVQLVLGYSPYRQKGGAVNTVQRYETLYTALQYLGMAAIGYPYMGVGRNLAYRKAFFQKAGGLARHAHLPGGDDDLLISHHARGSSTRFVIHPASWTYSAPATGWADYLSRKFRHLGVGGHYPLWIKALLGGLALSHIGVYPLGLILLGLGQYTLVFAIWLIRWGLIVAVIRRSTLNRSSLHPFSIPLIIGGDVAMAIYYLLLLPAPWIGRRARGGWR